MGRAVLIINSRLSRGRSRRGANNRVIRSNERRRNGSDSAPRRHALQLNLRRLTGPIRSTILIGSFRSNRYARRRRRYYNNVTRVFLSSSNRFLRRSDDATYVVEIRRLRVLR